MTIIFYMLLPTVVLWIALRLPSMSRALTRWYRRVRPQPIRLPDSPDHSLERLVVDLRRLSAEFDKLHGVERLPGKHLRLTALTQAYDDTLLSGCRMLGVPAPREHSPLSTSERLTTEVELARAGLDW